MKTNTKKKGNPAKKLIPAAGSLMVSAVMLATSTYAWFTMNKTVEVTGMKMKTKVGSNLLICTTNLDADYSANQLVQTTYALLEPVSSINGTAGSFWYTVDAKADGQKNLPVSSDGYKQYNESTALANTTAAKLKYDVGFNAAYGVVDSGTTPTSDQITGAAAPAYGYVDYVFYLKATSDAANQDIYMTQCDLQYLKNNTATELNQSGTVGDNIDRAWRIAVFAQDVTNASPGKGKVTDDITVVDNVDTNQKGLLRLVGAQYFGNDDKAVNGATTFGDVDSNADATKGVVIGTIDTANVSKYYKVVVRLWLEGEDNTCNSKTYAALTDDYSLDLQFKLDEDTGVKNISNNEFTPTIAATQSGTQKEADNVNY